MSTLADDFGIQLSINIPSGEQYEKGDMINIRGRNAQEFHANLTEFMQHCSTMAVEAARDVKAHARVAAGLNGTVVQQSQNAPQAPPQSPPQSQGNDPWAGQPQGQQWQGGTGQQNSPQGGYAPQNNSAPQGGNSGGIPTQPPPHVGPAPQCSHGTKKFLAKPYKNGKPGYWMAWACPAQRGDQSAHELEFIRQS
jgi:hypothetical protein